VQQITVTIAALSESAAAMTGQPGNSTAHMPAIAHMAREAFGIGPGERWAVCYPRRGAATIKVVVMGDGSAIRLRTALSRSAPRTPQIIRRRCLRIRQACSLRSLPHGLAHWIVVA
jgi:hypothetical protein